MFLLWHPSLTAINLSYTFPILETSATALCGTSGILIYKYIIYTPEILPWHTSDSSAFTLPRNPSGMTPTTAPRHCAATPENVASRKNKLRCMITDVVQVPGNILKWNCFQMGNSSDSAMWRLNHTVRMLECCCNNNSYVDKYKSHTHIYIYIIINKYV